MSDYFASIDIGTNTILMLIGEIKNNKIVRILNDEHSIARLGENVDASGIIQTSAIKRAGNILRHYYDLCSSLKVSQIRIVATSALRDAFNKDFVLAEFKKYINPEIEIISGEEEAELSFLGTVEDSSESIVIDIGGGSTEFIFGKNNNVNHRISTQIGAVRLTERFFKNHPPDTTQISLLNKYVRNELKNKLPNIQSSLCYAVAGTPTTICLLYTSPSPRDRQKSRMPSSA